MQTTISHSKKSKFSPYEPNQLVPRIVVQDGVNTGQLLAEPAPEPIVKEKIVYVERKRDMQTQSCQTDVELMLVIAADLFLSELSKAMDAMKRREMALQGVLKLQS
jgi:hypothetical protein